MTDKEILQAVLKQCGETALIQAFYEALGKMLLALTWATQNKKSHIDINLFDAIVDLQINLEQFVVILESKGDETIESYVAALKAREMKSIEENLKDGKK